MVKCIHVILCCVYLFPIIHTVKYEPDWTSLDSRPLPLWYDDAKLGIFVVWGVYSVPSYVSEWFWEYWQGPGRIRKDVVDFMKNNYPPGFTYADFASMFTAEFYNPDEWTDLIKASGAKYVVFTSKHHDGFTNWPSKYSFNWNSNATGPNRDIVGELADAIRKTDIKFGLYHSLFEWFNPLYLKDKEAHFSTQDFVKSKTIPELYEIVNRYKPEIVWSDGDVGPDTYWTSQKFLAWLYNESPVKDTVVTNDRWGNGCICKHGGYYTCTDRYNPGTLQKHKWENCMTIDRQSWGYRRNTQLSQFLSVHEIISTLASTVSCGGNMLMNVGPTKDGKIIPIFEERLRQLGQWLTINGEGIYGTKPWSHQNDTMTKHIWYTMKKSVDNTTAVYAILLSWPEDSVLKLDAPLPSPYTMVTMLGYSGQAFHWVPGPDQKGVYVTVPVIPWNKLPCQWAWVLKLTFIRN